MVVVNPGRGRPRTRAGRHFVVSRELTGAMRQLRIAGGEHTEATVEILNRVIIELCPEVMAADRKTVRGTSVPRTVSGSYLQRLEQGFHSSMKVPDWLKGADLNNKSPVRASKVPAWLVRAYDVAFGADGYLFDMYSWTHALSAEHQHDPPRQTTHLPGTVPSGEELRYLSDGFGDPPADILDVLRESAEHLARRRSSRSAGQQHVPSDADSSTTYGDRDELHPEGTLIEPGGYLLAGWVLHNTGTVPWRDRYVYRVGEPGVGITAPTLLVLPDTDVGGVVEIRCPVRAPTRPGTYRLCMKIGWRDGTYCYPATLLGVILTLIVAPADIPDWHVCWPSA